jgi:hypothetical protein
MSKAIEESVGESMMVTNVELVKEVDEQRQRNQLLEEALEEVKNKLDAVVEAAKKR